MKRSILFVILLSVYNIGYADPIMNINDFQKGIEKCVIGNSPGKCLTSHLSNHVPPGNEAMKKQLTQVASLYNQWRGNDSIYAIHPVKSEKVGDLVDIRYYAIEANAGGFMVMKIKYIKLLGKRYLLTFNLSSTDDAIDALLSGQL